MYIYVLVSNSRNYKYVGITEDIDRRIQEHNSGKESTTKPYIPFRLMFLTHTEGRVTARLIEKYLKSRPWSKSPAFRRRL